MTPVRPAVVGLLGVLARYRPATVSERADVDRIRALVEGGEPWARSAPLHVTASAVIVHPDSGRVLLRRHQRHQSWLLVGGHADPGEHDPLAVALREGREETGLSDLVAWPREHLLHVVIVPVPANSREPAHEHADLRFVLATKLPEQARPENPEAPLRWLPMDEARTTVTEANVRDTLTRVEPLLAR
ncbi:NUDIX hydrolase [Streptomyces sp. HPF1205]|uniref:NUDIX hydrolase n=1 Tax=Streptomyces sp. HPF1205 TaxID=2873262 RepID=UPI001CED8FBE|nr:NUDIX domain-containing protein [Streptomyces sp. HPF1205]